MGLSIVLNYNVQHRKVEQIIKKYWTKFRVDRDLKQMLPDRPKFMYKKAPLIKERNVQEAVHCLRGKQWTFFDGKWLLPCKRCYMDVER